MSRRIHPAIRPLLRQFDEAQIEAGTQMTVAQSRDAFRQSMEVLAFPAQDVERVTMRSGTGVPIHVFYPRGLDRTNPAPTLLFFHGGGWMLGDTASYAGFCATLAKAGGFAVASVDYRLAPENPFPAAHDDAEEATRWIFANAASLKIDRDRIVVAGDSAGANLAASVALRLHSERGFKLAGQALFYPVTDVAGERSSYRENAEGFVLTAEAMRQFRSAYLGSVECRDPRVALLENADLTDLPDTYILTCGLDPLRDEGIAYAQALIHAGNAVVHEHRPDMVHAYLCWTRALPFAAEDLRSIARRISERFLTTFGAEGASS